MILSYLCTLIDDGGTIGEIEIEILNRVKGRNGRRKGDDRGQIRGDKAIPHSVGFSRGMKGFGNQRKPAYIRRSGVGQYFCHASFCQIFKLHRSAGDINYEPFFFLLFRQEYCEAEAATLGCLSHFSITPSLGQLRNCLEACTILNA